jgi:site-specific DNA-methyltransferase (adenine-specific)
VGNTPVMARRATCKQFLFGHFWNADCFSVFPRIKDHTVAMILADLPYGTTQNKWDSVIPLEPLWTQFWRILKPNGVVVLFAAQPFTSELVQSARKDFKYDWTWRKPKGTGHLNAKKQPLRDKEDILVFYRRQPIYNPQFGVGSPYNGQARVGKKQDTPNYGKFYSKREDNPGRRYPKQVLEFGVVEQGTIHPTQKPVPLFEYLIRTYTNEGDLVLDNVAGSGTTAIACSRQKRRFICVEKDPVYFQRAITRISIEDFG